MAFLACCIRSNSVAKNRNRPPTRFKSVDGEEVKDSDNKELLSQEGLFDAIENGDNDEIKRYIDMGFDINVIDPEDGYTALLLACEQGHTTIVEMLLAGEADYEIRDSFGRSAVYAAAVANHAQVVDLLLKKGADPTIQDDDGRDPFWAVCALRHLDIARMLVERVDINTHDLSGETPMDHAAAAGHADVMNFLKEHGATESTARLSLVAPPYNSDNEGDDDNNEMNNEEATT
mmetsp:Transcript_12740/g.17115  ORF Transcript_12740/g.17115 Transcript_12740/m.17115 type:complete len:233 (-) Transcript_12740:154-852(-)|eukprot:CAMPEP_0197292454 /NCGR_PEP_ID=MMETSP0890-20130614/23437_1 /TAXON_ID=44058 ORGANISM="Aureoumbra lagunensis, Strain CCMP1510" /NCGR_SAMPLE_ID=MMETSP0890 /ASSEMBLY_ACC=CAM_ASM_000533 /LENGTH=232 /DNA_ID=CAMNT_0042766387 /DNA_START=163 /DNA_END=861 /DNA_ORIENTATION=-